MQRKRFDEIDLARALGIIGVISIHVLTNNLGNPINNFLWNYLQFFVITFVFCSGLVLTNAYSQKLNNLQQILPFYKKRLIRLAIPFWIYLVVHYSLWLAFPSLFHGLALSGSWEFFIKSALFIGGTNFNFLPLLFIQLTILFPLLILWFNKKKILYTYLFFSILITAIFTFAKFPFDLYRQTMWVPWSLILLSAIYLRNINIKKYLAVGTVSFVAFLILFSANNLLGKNEIFFNHKYPPDFYYLTFGLSITLFLLVVLRNKFIQNPLLKNSYNFVSRNSYKIFFIHYPILDLVLTLTPKYQFLHNPVTQFSLIFVPSIVIAYAFEKIQKRFKLL